jgi:hypothetical protein
MLLLRTHHLNTDPLDVKYATCRPTVTFKSGTVAMIINYGLQTILSLHPGQRHSSGSRWVPNAAAGVWSYRICGG